MTVQYLITWLRLYHVTRVSTNGRSVSGLLALSARLLMSEFLYFLNTLFLNDIRQKYYWSQSTPNIFRLGLYPLSFHLKTPFKINVLPQTCVQFADCCWNICLLVLHCRGKVFFFKQSTQDQSFQQTKLFAKICVRISQTFSRNFAFFRENAKCENFVKTMSVIAATINCSKELVEFSALIPQYLKFYYVILIISLPLLYKMLDEDNLISLAIFLSFCPQYIRSLMLRHLAAKSGTSFSARLDC